MAKRFTDTEKWKKPFIRSMKAPYKLLWLYILDECDHAGIWQVDIEVAQIKIGEKLNLETAKEYFKGRILELDFGDKWFIYDFIDFQYGMLNEQNRAHNSVINILKKHSIDFKNKPLISPLQGAKDKDMDKDKVKELDKDMDKELENAEKFELIFPYNSEKFKTAWSVLVGMKKWRKKSLHALQASLKQLSEFDEDFSITLIERAIAGEYQGLVFQNTKEEFNKLKNGTVTGKTNITAHERNKIELDEMLRKSQEFLRRSASGEFKSD